VPFLKERWMMFFEKDNRYQEGSSTEFAVGIDLGSNTLRVVKLECATGKIVGRYEKIVRTADGLIHSGMICRNAANRIIKAIGDAAAKVDFSGAKVRAVATEAIRKASNGKYVLEYIYENTGIDFEIINGVEEAQLTLLAVESRLTKLGMAENPFVLTDIGGGSTELVFKIGSKIIIRSFPVGIVTMAQRYPVEDELRRRLMTLMDPLKKFVRHTVSKYGKPEVFVATAGTPTTIAALKLGMDSHLYDPERVNGTVLEREDLSRWYRSLVNMGEEERKLAVGSGREDLIVAGILILDRLFSILGQKKCLVVDDGLREGVSLTLCQ